MKQGKVRAIGREGTIWNGVKCYVLEDGRRVIAKRSLSGVLSGNPSGHERDNFDQFLARLPNGSAVLDSATAIEVITPEGKGVAHAFEASVAVRYLRLYPEAWAAGALKKSQEPVAQRAIAFLAVLADIGITALIDEATGYQTQRPADALNQRLLEMIREATNPDVDPCYKNLLIGLDDSRFGGSGYQGTGNPPGYSRWVANVVVTCAFGEDGRQKLRVVNPEPTFRHRDEMHLDSNGKKVLTKTLGVAEAYATVADTRNEWERMMRAHFQGAALQRKWW